MKIRITIAAICLMAGLTACQKEISSEDGGGTGNSNGNSVGELLIKSVAKTGPDSLVTTYTYDASKRLIREFMKGKQNGQDFENDIRLIRDVSGIITQVIQKNPQFQAMGLDSAISKLYYDAGSSRYTARSTELALAGFSSVDSTVFIYNLNGLLIKQETYNGSPALGFPMSVNVKFEFTYSAEGNLIKNQSYSYDATTSSWELISVIDNGFDTKVNPLKLSSTEAAALLRPDWCSPNNANSVNFQDLATGLASFSMTASYTYNTQNKPATSQSTRQGVTTNTVFYYQ